MPATSTIEKMDATTWFSTLFSAYESNLNGHRDHPHAQFRRAGFDALVERTFPTRRDEDWKYTGLTKVLANKYQEGKAVELSDEQLDNLTIQGFDSLKLVFINGVLSTNVEDLPLPDGLRILRLEEAFSEGELSSWIQSQSSYEGGTTKNTFVQLNQAFGQEGVVIIAEPNAQFTLPIELLYINSVGTEESHFSNPQVFVHAQRGASFSIIERYEGLDDEDVYLTNTVNRIYVEENTHLHHYRLQLESSSAYQINSTFVQQDRSSTYSSYNLDLGGGIVRNNISALSKGSGTETNLFGTYVINGTQHVDNQTFIDHAVPHCVSNELYRGVLDDKSRGVFNGKALVFWASCLTITLPL
ncbi:MAG: SufD family Fe-S cluster assembly protein, partial [Bacteroidota bacterium]